MFKEFKTTALIFGVLMAVWITMLIGCGHTVHPTVSAAGEYRNTSSTAIVARPSSRIDGLIAGRRAAVLDHQDGTDCVVSDVSDVYLCELQIPLHRFKEIRGQSTQYIIGYKRGYLNESKRLHKSRRFWAKQPDGRWVVGAVVVVILIVGAIAA